MGTMARQHSSDLYGLSCRARWDRWRVSPSLVESIAELLERLAVPVVGQRLSDCNDSSYRPFDEACNGKRANACVPGKVVRWGQLDRSHDGQRQGHGTPVRSSAGRVAALV